MPTDSSEASPRRRSFLQSMRSWFKKSDPPAPARPSADVFRIAAIGDLHVVETPLPFIRPLLDHASASANVLIICGDLTDHGRPAEARCLAQDLAQVKIPVLAVLGNHDHDANAVDELRAIFADANVKVLDGDTIEIGGIGFAGVKGFGGGFGRNLLSSFGESAVKRYAQEASNEAMKLEAALSRLRAPQRIAITHYAPILATLGNERPELSSYLGCSLLEDAINRSMATIAFHGHSHRGAADGRTSTGIPVHNVALPVLRKSLDAQPPIKFVDLARVAADQGQQQPHASPVRAKAV